MMNKILAISLSLGALTLVACTESSSDSAEGMLTCGQGGQSVTIDDEAFCVYSRELVVENGFSCPQGAETLTELGPMGVCSAGDLERRQLEELARRDRDNNPDRWDGDTCPEGDQQIEGPDQCAQDDAVCYELDDDVWCTAPSTPECPAGFSPTDMCEVLNDDCFQFSESLLCQRDAITSCEEAQARYAEELASIQSCTTDTECGEVLTGTSCGCTRNLVARNDADTTSFYSLQSTLQELDCGLGGSTCDCPEADGFACVEGLCTWNYVSQ